MHGWITEWAHWAQAQGFRGPLVFICKTFSKQNKKRPNTHAKWASRYTKHLQRYTKWQQRDAKCTQEAYDVLTKMEYHQRPTRYTTCPHRHAKWPQIDTKHLQRYTKLPQTDTKCPHRDEKWPQSQAKWQQETQNICTEIENDRKQHGYIIWGNFVSL